MLMMHLGIAASSGATSDVNPGIRDDGSGLPAGGHNSAPAALRNKHLNQAAAAQRVNVHGGWCRCFNAAHTVDCIGCVLLLGRPDIQVVITAHSLDRESCAWQCKGLQHLLLHGLS